MERGWRSGPRPPTRPHRTDFADPANGCFNGCGEDRPSMLRSYELIDKCGVPRGRWVLCADCLAWGNPPQLDPDPLYVDGDAA